MENNDEKKKMRLVWDLVFDGVHKVRYETHMFYLEKAKELAEECPEEFRKDLQQAIKTSDFQYNSSPLWDFISKYESAHNDGFGGRN